VTRFSATGSRRRSRAASASRLMALVRRHPKKLGQVLAVVRELVA
jgi:hypothetical protein